MFDFRLHYTKQDVELDYFFESNERSNIYFFMDINERQHFNNLGIVIEKTIAEGGHGVIYEAYSTQYKTNFAFKKVPLKGFNQSEIETLTSLDHQNIVRLYKIYRYNSFVYLLLELCPNDLDKFLNKNKHLDDLTIKKLAGEVINAVKACHDHNIAHGDIKPSNFLFDKYERLKICDFGLSSHHADSHLNHTFRGTPFFMAPELIGKSNYNPIKSDIWAIGVTLYYIATHKYPFKSKSIQSLKILVSSGYYNQEIIPNKDLRDLIARCLVVEPERRATVDELLNMPFFKPTSCSTLPPLPQSNRLQHSNSTIKRQRGVTRLSITPLKKWMSSSEIPKITPNIPKITYKSSPTNSSVY